MKFWILVSAVTALVLSSSVNAAFIKDGGVVTDDVTGLEWLDLLATTNVSYTDALTVANQNHGSGWRYATQAEVEQLMGSFFPNYSQTHESGDGGYEYCVEGGCYDAERRQSADEFYDLFGTHRASWENAYASGVNEYASGFVASPNGATAISVYGITHTYRTSGSARVPSSLTVYMDSYTTPGGAINFSVGTFLVNGPLHVVPVPAAAWLFSSGLIGLVGFARRKKS